MELLLFMYRPRPKCMSDCQTVALPASKVALPPVQMPPLTTIGPAMLAFLTQRLQGVSTRAGKAAAASVSMMRLPNPPMVAFDPNEGPFDVTIVLLEYTP